MSMPSSWRKAIVSRASGAQLLGEHHDAHRPQAARAAGRPGAGSSSGDVAGGERQHAPAGLGLLARARRRAARPSVEVLGRPQHVGAAAHADAAPAPARGERHAPLDRLGLAAARRPAIASSVEVLPGELAAKRPSEDRELPLVDALGGHQLDHAEGLLGERAGLVEADHVGGRERLDGVELLAQRAAPRHPHRSRPRRSAATSSTRPSGTIVMTPATAVATDSRNGVSCSISDQPSSSAQRHHRDADQHQEPVERQLQRGARVAELARLAHQALRVGVRRRRPRRRRRPSPLDGVRPGAHAVARRRATPARPRRSGSTRPRRAPPRARAARRPPPGRRRPPARGRRARRRRRRPAPGGRRAPPSRAARPAPPGGRGSPWPAPPGRSRCPAFRTRIARKMASRQSPKISVTMPKNSSVTLKTVSRLARRMLDHERLVGGGSTSPRAARRRLGLAPG